VSHVRFLYEKSEGWYDNQGELSADFVVTSVNATSDLFTASGGHGLTIGNRVSFVSTTDIPGGLEPGFFYWVISEGFTSTTFKVSSTEGGPVKNITDVGAGTIRGSRPRGYSLTIIRHSAIFLFENVQIPQGSSIDQAWLEVSWQLSNPDVCKGNFTLAASLTAYDADDTDNHWPNSGAASTAPWEYPSEISATHWATNPDFPPNADRVSSSTSFNILTVTNGSPNATTGTLLTPSQDRAAVGTMLQSVVGRPGWAAGNNLILFLDESSSPTTNPLSPGHVAGVIFGSPVLRFTFG